VRQDLQVLQEFQDQQARRDLRVCPGVLVLPEVRERLEGLDQQVHRVHLECWDRLEYWERPVPQDRTDQLEEQEQQEELDLRALRALERRLETPVHLVQSARPVRVELSA